MDARAFDRLWHETDQQYRRYKQLCMLEYGQPLHTFDYDKLKDHKIIVRRALAGESITSLDGVERKLTSNMLVIADPERAVAIAGVMGGSNTEVTDQTTSILIEAANFKASNIRITGGLLNLESEARYRFERGIAPGLTIPALRKAARLIAELGDGKVSKDMQTYIQVKNRLKLWDYLSLS